MILKIYNYNEFLKVIKKNNYSIEEQEQIKQWYRDYYTNIKEQERGRYIEYYLKNIEEEKQRAKKRKTSE